MQPPIEKINIGDSTLQSISEWDGPKRMDTEIRINGGLLCWISGEDYDKFINQFKELVNNFRI